MTKPVPQDMQDVINEVSTTDSGRGDLANQYKVLDTIIEDSLKDANVDVTVTNTSLSTVITQHLDICGAVHTIDHAHHEIHEGNYWFADNISTSLGSGNVYEWLVVTPNEDIFLHSLPQFIGTGEFEVQVYEGATVTGNGTEIPILNRNRAVGGTTTFKLYKNPTGANITNCPLIRNIRTGAGKSVGESRAESEIILNKNTKYLARATARVAGVFVSAHLNGYACGIGAS